MAFVLAATPLVPSTTPDTVSNAQPRQCTSRVSPARHGRQARPRVRLRMTTSRGDVTDDNGDDSGDWSSAKFRPHAVPAWTGQENCGPNESGGADGMYGDNVPLELVEGYLDNAKVRPKIDIDADEYMLMWKLRTMLHEDDFNKIFDAKSRRIGEL